MLSGHQPAAVPRVAQALPSAQRSESVLRFAVLPLGGYMVRSSPEGECCYRLTF
jgi:hypothetical protein